jgi:hypothetical protein
MCLGGCYNVSGWPWMEDGCGVGAVLFLGGYWVLTKCFIVFFVLLPPQSVLGTVGWQTSL